MTCQNICYVHTEGSHIYVIVQQAYARTYTRKYIACTYCLHPGAHISFLSKCGHIMLKWEFILVGILLNFLNICDAAVTHVYILYKTFLCIEFHYIKLCLCRTASFEKKNYTHEYEAKQNI